VCEVVSGTSLLCSFLRFKGVPELLSVINVLLELVLLVALLLKTYIGDDVFVLACLYSLASFLFVLHVAVLFVVCACALLLMGSRCFHTCVATTA
jgi:hypothetical protein